MNVSIENRSDVDVVMTVDIVADDYRQDVEKSLRSYRQRADIKGFRKGNVPMGMIKKMYGRPVKIDQINQAVGRAIGEYIHAHKLNILGEPIPHEGQPEADFDNQEDFTFKFDLAVEPKIEVELGKKDKLVYYDIKPTDEMIDKHIEGMRNSMGASVDTEVSEENDIVYGHLVELAGEEADPEGIEVKEAMLLPRYIKEEENKKQFIGLHVGDKIDFEPFKAFGGDERELASFLNIDKTAVAATEGKTFEFKVSRISRHKPADLNETFYKAAFGENTPINTEEELRKEIERGFKEQFKAESDYKFLLDLRKYLIEKAGTPQFADETLKRWLKLNDPKRTDEDVEKEYPQMIKELTYHILHKQLVGKHDIKVTPEDVKQFALIAAKNQFAQYGMTSVPDDILERYANSMLEKEDANRNFTARVEENKLGQVVRDIITVENKEVSMEEFQKLFETEA
ncbi:Trigger factor [Porphyromonas macacae]|uniref:Trigger factor n=2 Tax=Porphyromonas macacae TaxID=28115 RepID=A0A379DJA8_9PORP|nr:trigger factor [Porphyromonas macacae]SUB78044.1 Trigger factor [Porphyromonas macacae]